jgi:hypothetical protein
MAKPIRATPVLRGEDAKRFVREWLEEIEHPSKERIAFITNARREGPKYLKQLGII